MKLWLARHHRFTAGPGIFIASTQLAKPFGFAAELLEWSRWTSMRPTDYELLDLLGLGHFTPRQGHPRSPRLRDLASA